MVILYVIILILAIGILLLALGLYLFSKKSSYISDKEREFIVFAIDIFTEYGDDLGIQSKEQHKKLCDELSKIKNKHFKIKKDDKT
jgi:hypothetical protein